MTINIPLIHIDFLWTLTSIFGALGVLYLFAIVVSKKQFDIGLKKVRFTREELAPIISNFLFHDSNEPIAQQKEYVELKIKIRDHLQNRHFRKVLSSILIDLSKDVDGNIKNRLFRLYRELELHEDAIQRLKSWQWNRVSFAIYELSQMRVQEALPHLINFLGDKRGIARKKAEIGLLRLSSKGIENILDNSIFPISQWQQLKLIEVLGEQADYCPPKFSKWLLSSNKHVVLLTLRLIKHFNQNDAQNAIVQLLHHKDREVQIEAIECAIVFHISESISVLKKICTGATAPLKTKVLEAIGKLGTNDDLPFLFKLHRIEKDGLILNKITTTIYELEPNAILPTEDLVNYEENAQLEEIHEIEEEIISEEPLEETPVEVDVLEIEVFEMDELDFVEKEETIINEENSIPTENKETLFDLSELEGEENTAFSKELGLVHSTVNETVDSGETEAFNEYYDQISIEEKEQLVENLKDGEDEASTQYLESVIESEDNSELRFKAFTSLANKQQKDTPDKTYDWLLKKRATSVFEYLKDSEIDIQTQTMLLEVAADLGGVKDLEFLRSIQLNGTVTTKKWLKHTIARISDRNPVEQHRPVESSTTDEVQFELYSDDIIERILSSDHTTLNVDEEKPTESTVIELAFELSGEPLLKSNY